MLDVGLTFIYIAVFEKASCMYLESKTEWREGVYKIANTRKFPV